MSDLRAPVSFVLLLALWANALADENPKVVDLADVVEKVRPSVVHLVTAAGGRITGSGAGFVLHEDGYIATAAHVVEEADLIEARFLDGKRMSARIVTMTRAEDLALLKVDQLPEGTKAVKLADASKVRPGQGVFCIGAPRGYAFSVTAGIVSAIRKTKQTRYSLHEPGRLIQTDAAINPGNSGGPIFNTKGHVIGIAVQRNKDAEAIGFAVPSDLIRRYLIDEAIPFTGVMFHRIPPVVASILNWPPAEALLIERVNSGSLAKKAGLRGGRVKVDFGGVSLMLGGDVIYKIGGHPVSDLDAVGKYLRSLKKDDEIVCTIWREGELTKLKGPFQILDPLPKIQLMD